MSLTKTLNKGKQKVVLNISQIRENTKNFYENANIYKKSYDKEFTEDIELISLANSIADKGQLHNVVVYEDTTINDGKEYTLLSGARRYKAIQYLVQTNRSDGSIDAVIREKPNNIMEEMDIIVDSNNQRKPDLQNNPQMRYQEVLEKEMLFDELRAKGEIQKGKGMHKRKFVALQLGISEGSVENLHKKFDVVTDEPKKKTTKLNKNASKKNKYNEIAQEIQREVSAVCDTVKLTENEITFKYDCLEDLEHLLEMFKINVSLDEFKEWLQENI